MTNIISHYLDEIAERLWTEHASIMIGAGFSRNAQKANATAKEFPSWVELGDIFFHKIHGRKPQVSDKAYLNVLKLADEVEATYGKAYINNLIRAELPDKEYHPSELHKKLLLLPWKDIFTTNYDTLLERTAELIVDKRYEIVSNKHDLVWSKSPRIIKLHGSFPSERPFIISGEDYRKYPVDYAPFVNTVQQSLLENTLCLIGFSGDDPNFLNWIGWIRDNLGKENSPKIYLIGVLNLSSGQRKLLEDRNIIPIDLSCLCTEKVDHYKAIETFIEYLHSYNKVNAEDWADRDTPEDRSKVDFNKLLSHWTEHRAHYPGWLILPAEKREKLLNQIERISFSQTLFDAFDSPNDILFLYEFNWRIEKCLYPIMNDWVSVYESIINKYNPFHEDIEIDNALTRVTAGSLDWDRIGNSWIGLQLSLLRLFREEGWSDRWNSLASVLDKISGHFSNENKARFHYEKCLYQAFNFDIKLLKKSISEWPVDMSLPYWEAKRATLLAEFDATTDAIPILEQSLKEVRARLNLSPIRNDYTLVSLEAYIMLLHRCVSKADEMSRRILRFEHTDNYQQRWRTLEQYDCDPWQELEYFDLRILLCSSNTKAEETRTTFDIDRTTTTYKFDAGKKYILLAWGYFRYLEDVGLPYHFPRMKILEKDSFGKALSIMAQYNSFFANAAMIRYGDRKSVVYIFDRKTLSGMSSEQVDKVCQNYIELLRLTYKANQSRDNIDNIVVSISATLPEVLSRLCCKLSFDYRKELLNILKDIYIAGIVDKYENIYVLIKRLIRSFTITEQYELILEFLKFPIYFDNYDNRYFDPFHYIREVKGKGLVVESGVVNELISKLLVEDKTRTIAFNRLQMLLDLGVIKSQQKVRFAKNLWALRDDNGFPKLIPYHYYSFIHFPHPKDVDPAILLREYIRKTLFPMNAKKENSSISFLENNISIWVDIAGTDHYKKLYKWSADEINILVDIITECWNSGKSDLLNEERFFGLSKAEDLRKEFNKSAKKVIINFIASNTKVLTPDALSKLQIMIDELPEYDVYNLEIKISLPVIYSDWTAIENDIIHALSSGGDDQIFDAVNAVITSLSGSRNVKKLINVVTENFRCGKTIGLTYCLGCINEILKSNNKYISQQALENIALGLEYMLEYTSIKEDDDVTTVNDKIRCRQKIAKIVVNLAHYNQRFDFSTIIDRWERVLTDKDEFLDIRNQYINTLTQKNDLN